MAQVSKKPEQKPHKASLKELRKRDALALAQLIYDIYKDKRRKEKNDEVS